MLSGPLVTWLSSSSFTCVVGSAGRCEDMLCRLQDGDGPSPEARCDKLDSRLVRSLQAFGGQGNFDDQKDPLCRRDSVESTHR